MSGKWFTLTVIDAHSQNSDDREETLIPEKLSIRQYLDEKLMPSLLPALNELVKKK